MWRRLWTAAGAGLLALVYPERCVLCDAQHGHVPWSGPSAPGPGTGAWDGPHLCAACAGALAPQPVAGRIALDTVPPREIPLWAGRPTDANLVTALGAWKYHGVRGVAIPLGALVRAAVAAATAAHGPVDHLVPLPLHRRRRRARGFNQAAVLARRAAGPPVTSTLLVRTRATPQQAQQSDPEARRRNVAGAFAAQGSPDRGGAGGGSGRVGLVDDLVTGGATAASAAQVLVAAGWDVAWVVAAGAAAACLDADTP